MKNYHGDHRKRVKFQVLMNKLDEKKYTLVMYIKHNMTVFEYPCKKVHTLMVIFS